MPQHVLSEGPSAKQDRRCMEAWASGAVSGCLAGLLGGMVWGIVQEKKFIFRNMTKDYHQREHPIQLFSVMMRGTKSMVIMGTFFGTSSVSASELLQLQHPHTPRDSINRQVRRGSGHVPCRRSERPQVQFVPWNSRQG